MSLPNYKDAGEYTYEDYLKWDDGQRWEIIDGVPYCMSPAPCWIHQGIVMEISKQIAVYLTGKTCMVFNAPFDVRLPKNGQNDLKSKNIVQSDIVVICDRSKLKGTGCCGTPDMIVEVISPSSGKMDRILKFREYEKAGVKEYWIVQPDEKTIMVFKLDKNGQYGRPELYSDEDVVKVEIFEDFKIDLQKVFGFISIE